MPKDFARVERVERLAREVLGEAVLELKDPRVGFATVTAVRMTPDLRHARVWVSVLGEEEERSATMDAIRHAGPHLRTVLGQEVRLRYLPQLEFLEDESAIQGARIDEILRSDPASTAPEESEESEETGESGETGAPGEGGAGERDGR